MRIKSILMVGTIIGMPAIAVAQPISGLYVGAGAGANFLQNETSKGLSFPGGKVVGAGSNPKFDTGAVGVGSVGWGFGNGLRLELEGNYRWNQARSVGGFGTAVSGNEQKYGAMVNALYDIDLRPFGVNGITPYFGAGAGYVHDEWYHVGIASQGGAFAQDVHVNSGRDSFAAQGIAGVAYSLDSIAPGLALTAEYRFYDVPNEQKYAAQYFAPGTTSGPKLRVGNDINHAVLIGLRYAFNAAPPPPPPQVPVTAAPPVAPATRSYLVFFDWDRADLTDRARNIIADAAANSKRVQYTKIAVNGYTDLSGTAQYNQGLSVRRAQAVAGELTKDGVPSSAISIQGFGETHPLVPTAAGVREPQNRRVEIIIQ